LQRRINSFDGAAVEESSACCGVNLAVPFRFAGLFSLFGIFRKL
jgi:hypothetical protein